MNSFRYLGHIIDKSASDNDDIDQEIRNLFIRTNIFIRKFHICSHSVEKLGLGLSHFVFIYIDYRCVSR